LDVSYLFSCTLIDAGPVKMALGWVLPPPELSQAEVEFPRVPDPPKGGHNGTDRS